LELEEAITFGKGIPQDCQQGLGIEVQHEDEREEKEKETVIGEDENENEQFFELCNEVRYRTNWIECDRCETWICEECHDIPEMLSKVFKKKGVFWFCTECETSSIGRIESVEHIGKDSKQISEEFDNEKEMQIKDKNVEACVAKVHKQTSAEESNHLKEERKIDKELRKWKEDIAKLEQNIKNKRDKKSKIKE